MTPIQICPACREQQWRWIDTSPQQMFPRLAIVSHAAYDSTPAGVRDNRKARYERWRTTVLTQVAGIADDCRRQGHDTVGGGE